MKQPKVDRSYFNEQVLRLSATQFFPAIKAGIKELIDSLIRVSKGDEDRARRIIDQGFHCSGKYGPRCPTPADLEAIASNLGEETIPNGCEKCEGTGFRYTSQTFARTALNEKGKPYVYETYEADCQVRCDCELGRFLADRDTQRKKSA